MKLRWTIVAASSGALACVGVIIWHFVHAELTARRLVKDATAYRVRAEQGDAQSQLRLGSMYYYGKGVSKDYSEAARWYRKSAEQGNPKAEYSLGDMYREGKGVPQDYAEAARWCRKAAEQGEAMAQDGLGFMYYRGEGVQQDYAEAARWYRKSAEQGYPNGRYDLGYMYSNGYGVPKDPVEANRLFHEAAAQGNERARQVIAGNKVRVPATSKILLPLKFLASLYFGVAFLKSGKRHRTREQTVTGVAALLLICAVALDLFWRLYVGHLQSSATITLLYLIRHLVSGAIVGVLAFIVYRKSAKTVLIAAAAIFVGFIVFEVVHSEIRHIPVRVWFLCFVGLPVGMSIPSAIFLWLDGKSNGTRVERQGDPVIPVTTK